MKTIGDRIRGEREAQGLTRDDLASYAGMAKTTLSDLELGESKSTTKLHRIAEKLGVSADWLATGKGPKRTLEVASQTARLTAATVVNATQAIRTFLGRRGVEYDPIEHAGLFVAVYPEAARIGENPSNEELMTFASAVADLVQQHVGGTG